MNETEEVRSNEIVDCSGGSPDCISSCDCNVPPSVCIPQTIPESDEGQQTEDNTGENESESESEEEEQEGLVEEELKEEDFLQEKSFSNPISARTILLEGGRELQDVYLSAYKRMNIPYIRINGREMKYREFQKCLNVLQDEFPEELDAYDVLDKNAKTDFEIVSCGATTLTLFMLAGSIVWIILFVQGMNQMIE